MKVDALDVQIVSLMHARPRISVLQISRDLGVARATVSSRLDRMEAAGVISFAPVPDPAGFGYPVTAFISIEIHQLGDGNPTAEALKAVPEIMSIHSTTGGGDLLVRVVARSNRDLQQVIHRIIGVPGVVRTSTQIAMHTFLEQRTLDVFAASVRKAEHSET